MAGDGNCLFRSVAHQVYGDPEQHFVVREKALNYIERQRDYFEAFVEDGEDFFCYCERMKKNGEWGGEMVIQAMSELYGRPVEVYAYQTLPMRVYNSRVGVFPVRLSYHFQSHYNSVVHPETSRHYLQSRPGEREDEHIVRMGQRNEQKFRSDETLADLARTTQYSREHFSKGKTTLSSFEAQLMQAVQRSLAEDVEMEVDSPLAAAITESERAAAEQKMMEDAKLQSLAEASQAHSGIEDDIKRAMAASLQSGSGKSADDELEQALALSLETDPLAQVLRESKLENENKRKKRVTEKVYEIFGFTYEKKEKVEAGYERFKNDASDDSILM